MFLYRKDVFEQKGFQPLTTFDEMYAIAKQLKTDDMAGYDARQTWR